MTGDLRSICAIDQPDHPDVIPATGGQVCEVIGPAENQPPDDQ
jgi:hypothetical protein